MKRRTSFALAATAATLLAVFLWPEAEVVGEPDLAPTARGSVTAEPQAAVLREERTVEPVPAIASDDTTPMIEMRDGTRLPALNGVTDTSNLKWAASRSATPVTGVIRGRAYDAYVHEDGSQTTTIEVTNLLTGEKGTSAVVAHPLPIGDKPIIRLDYMDSAQPLPPRNR